MTSSTIQCIPCGFEASSDDDSWERVEYPPLGSMTQCPECGSTNTHAT